MTFSDTDYRDIQGLVRFGFGHLKAARFHLLRIVDAAAARSWLAARIPAVQQLVPVASAAYPPEVEKTAGDRSSERVLVTTAEKGKRPRHALQVAFTHAGLKELGVAQNILDGFSDEFVQGMVEESRSRRLGDVGASRPECWRWGGRDPSDEAAQEPSDRSEKMPHMLVLLYAAAGGLDRLEAPLQDQVWDKAFVRLESLSTIDLDGFEPFGFRDGISEPVLDWERSKPIRLQQTADYTNLSALGEILLGYPNEYGRYTDRPLLDARADPDAILPLAEDKPGKKDFGRNGSYLVLRDLAQDVAGFRHHLEQQAGQDPAKAEALAYAMVGRTRAGEPIVKLSDRPIAGVAYQGDEKERMTDHRLNQFTYDADPDGTACPHGAHIRRANPRNADLPAGTRGPFSRLMRVLGFGVGKARDDLISSTRFHRILRRGREYAERIEPGQDLRAAVAGERGERGLRFICLNANISRQFEFIQASWIANPKFEGLDESDPLLGNRAPMWAGGSTDTFTRPQDSGLCRRIGGLHRFVTVRGGAYFFLPGISALRYLARM